MFYKNILWTGSLLLMLFSLVACEEAFTPEISNEPPELVVEGYIEAGEDANPPFVILTKSSPFFSEINLQEFDDLFVHDATIRISDGEQEVQLTELCINDLSEEQQAIAAELFGLNTDSLTVNFCVYLDLSFGMMGEEGKTYDLSVETEGKRLTASTYIPFHVPIDSLFLTDAPGVPNDTLRQMRGFLTDPAGTDNYYRFLTGTNGSTVTSNVGSVFDDAFFDGLNFEFVLTKSDADFEELEPDEFGLFVVGDTATIKWISLPESHFNFWNTLEFNAANQGPFSSYTRIESNIEGGLGIWGGSSVSYYEVVIE